MTVAKPEASPSNDPVAVRIRGVAKHFGTGDQRVLALRGVDWDIYKGQMSLIVGPSGCGKTTLLSVIAGILNADEGDVSVFGQKITAMRDREKTRFRARSIGFVFQQYKPPPRAHGRRKTRRSRWSSPAGGDRRPSHAPPWSWTRWGWARGRRACRTSSPAVSSSGSPSARATGARPEPAGL